MSPINADNRNRKPFSLESRTEFTVFSLASLPLVWLLLQSHHMLLCAPIAHWLTEVFPFIEARSQLSMAFPIATINLGLWGALALLWPTQGFGHHWRPERRQSIVVLICIGLTLFFPALNTFLQRAIQTNAIDSFKSMGFVTWTITPVGEEILFRGFLYALLLKIFHGTPDSSWRKVLPVLFLGSAWFSLWHIYPDAIVKHGWNAVLFQVFWTFWGGLFFNIMRHWTGSIWLVIPLHAAGNFMVNFM